MLRTLSHLGPRYILTTRNRTSGAQGTRFSASRASSVPSCRTCSTASLLALVAKRSRSRFRRRVGKRPSRVSDGRCFKFFEVKHVVKAMLFGSWLLLCASVFCSCSGSCCSGLCFTFYLHRGGRRLMGASANFTSFLFRSHGLRQTTRTFSSFRRSRGFGLFCVDATSCILCSAEIHGFYLAICAIW